MDIIQFGGLMEAAGVDGSTAVLGFIAWGLWRRSQDNIEVLRELTREIAKMSERINTHT